MKWTSVTISSLYEIPSRADVYPQRKHRITSELNLVAETTSGMLVSLWPLTAKKVEIDPPRATTQATQSTPMYPSTTTTASRERSTSRSTNTQSTSSSTTPSHRRRPRTLHNQGHGSSLKRPQDQLRSIKQVLYLVIIIVSFQRGDTELSLQGLILTLRGDECAPENVDGQTQYYIDM